MKVRLIMKQFVLAIGFLIGISSAASADIVQNGGFETGYFSPHWTAIGNVTVVAAAIASTPYGSYYASFNAGSASPNGVLSQSLNTVAGTDYELMFAYGSNSSKQITAQVSDLGLNVLGSLVATGDSTGTLNGYSLVFRATSATTLLDFYDDAGNTNSALYGSLDNVYVSDVPEPMSLALFGLGMTGLVLARRKQV